MGIPCFLGGMSRGLLGRYSDIQARQKRGEALKEADIVILAGESLCLPPTGSGDILFFPVRLSVCPSVRPSVCLSVTNRVRSIT